MSVGLNKYFCRANMNSNLWHCVQNLYEIMPNNKSKKCITKKLEGDMKQWVRGEGVHPISLRDPFLNYVFETSQREII